MPKKFVVVIDTQYDFMMSDGKLPVPGAENLIVPGIRYLSHLKDSEVAGVLFTFDSHNPDEYVGSPESKSFPIHCVYGEHGWSNVFSPDLVNPDIPTYMLSKGVFNMWEEPNILLHDMLSMWYIDRDLFFKREEALGEALDTIEIWGVASDFCVKWAIDGFLKRGYKVQVVEHLTAGIERDIKQVLKEEYEGKPVTLV